MSGDLIFRNTFKDIEFVLATLGDAGTRFEFECYDNEGERRRHWSPRRFAPREKIVFAWAEGSKLLIQNGLEPHDAADLEIAPKKVAHEYSVLLDDMERPVLDPVAERNHSAHPDAGFDRIQ